MNRFTSALGLAALLAVLAACHADLDWRELRAEEGAFSLYFPARAFEDARELVVAGQKVRMRQWSAQVRDTLFAVSYADFDPLGPAAYVALRDALVGNIAGRVLSEQELGAGVREIVAAGQSGGAPLMLRLRLISNGGRLYQVAVLGKPDEVTPADIDFFFRSFRLLTPGRSSPAAAPPGPRPR